MKYRTLERTDPRTGKKFSVKSFICHGKSRDGTPCEVYGLPTPDKDGLHYCHWHTSNPKKKAVSRFDSKHPSYTGRVNGHIPKAGSTPKKRFKVEKVEKQAPSPNFPTPEPMSMGENFAASLSTIIEEMTKESMKKIFQNMVFELNK